MHSTYWLTTCNVVVLSFEKGSDWNNNDNDNDNDKDNDNDNDNDNNNNNRNNHLSIILGVNTYQSDIFF